LLCLLGTGFELNSITLGKMAATCLSFLGGAPPAVMGMGAVRPLMVVVMAMVVVMVMVVTVRGRTLVVAVRGRTLLRVVLLRAVVTITSHI